MEQKVMECTQVGSGGHVLVAEGYIKSTNGNGNAVFLLRGGAERQESGNGGAKDRMGWY